MCVCVIYSPRKHPLMILHWVLKLLSGSRTSVLPCVWSVPASSPSPGDATTAGPAARSGVSLGLERKHAHLRVMWSRVMWSLTWRPCGVLFFSAGCVPGMFVKQILSGVPEESASASVWSVLRQTPAERQRFQLFGPSLKPPTLKVSVVSRRTDLCVCVPLRWTVRGGFTQRSQLSVLLL